MFRMTRPMLFLFAALIFAALPSAHSAEKKKEGKQFEVMDYGPFLISTIDGRDNNWIPKSVTIHLNEDKTHNVSFDTDLLRIGVSWSGGYQDWKGPTFSGSHANGPGIKGSIDFATKPVPGWAKDGSFDDPRKDHDGVLPKDWARYKGLYIHSGKVILSYTVGDAKVLEMEGIAGDDAAHAFTRTFEISGNKKPLQMIVSDYDGATAAEADAGVAALNVEHKERTKVKQKVKKKKKVDGKDVEVEVEEEVEKDMPVPHTLLAGLIGAPAGVKVSAKGTRIILEVPASAAVQKFALVVGSLPRADTAKFKDFLNGKVEDLEPLTKGGPAHWTETVTTHGTLGDDKTAKTGNDPEAPYVVDTIAPPDTNPYHSWLRFGAFDFFKDGTTAAISTWSGDVWLVKNIDAELKNVVWKRYATGLFQPLGLKIVDDVVYTLGRDGITKLVDLNGDGEADYYEAFNNELICTPGFHEFAFELQTDAEGNFYFAKGSPVRPGGRGFERVSEHAGCFMKVSKDGSKMDIIATGLRAPNGIGVGPHGELTSGDNQGTWTPADPLNWIKPGGFYGVVESAHRNSTVTERDKPVCWLPYTDNGDRSCGGQPWVTSSKWGPFEGSMLYLSYSHSSFFKVFWEDLPDGTKQGGVVQFPLKFQTGIMRGRFNPVDGQLYVSGLTGWQSNGPKDHAFQRVRYTGKPVNMPTALKVTHAGVDISFTTEVDPVTANDPTNYSVETWNMVYSDDYGSPEYSPKDMREKGADPVAFKPISQAERNAKNYKKGRDHIAVKSAKLSVDGKTVSLELEENFPVTNMATKLKLKAKDGAAMNYTVFNTIYKVP